MNEIRLRYVRVEAEILRLNGEHEEVLQQQMAHNASTRVILPLLVAPSTRHKQRPSEVKDYAKLQG